ncbi:MAG TPA: hypothetical protein VFL41_06550 [Gaiellaceae bacterium]|nr:hypothetical protein [Gaiellaceae bacterium]
MPPCSNARRSQALADRVVRVGDVKVSVSAEWASAGDAGRVTWIVKVTNRTDAALRLVHPSSQYAAVILRRMGRVAYSTRRGGYPAFWTWTLPPRATVACSLVPDALDQDTLKTSRYDVAVHLNLSPVAVEAHRPLSIVGG